MKKLLSLFWLLSISFSSYTQSQTVVDSILEVTIDSVYGLRAQDAYLEAYNFMLSTEQELALDEASCTLRSQHFYLKAVCLYYYDSLGLALEQFQEQVLPSYENCWGSLDGETGYIHYMIGLVNASLGDYYAGIEAFLTSANIYAKLENRLSGEEAAVYQELGYLLHKVNDHASAERYLKQAESIYQSEIELNAYGQADFLNTYGIVLRLRGKTAEAETCFQDALRYLLPLRGPFELRRKAEVYQNLSTISLDYGRLRESRNYLQSSIQMSKDNNYQDLLAKNYDQLGTLKKRTGELDSARYYYDLALDLKQALKQADLNEHVANTYENLGDVEVLQQNFNAGIQNYQLGVAELVEDSRGLSLYENPTLKDKIVANRFYLAQTLNQKAQAYLQLSDQTGDAEALSAALETYDKIDTLLTQIRQGLSDGGSKYILQEDIKKVYDKAVQTNLSAFEEIGSQESLERAYQLAAKNKALVLLEGLQDERAKSFAGIPSAILRKERQLKKNYYELEARLLAAGAKAPFQALGADSLFRLRQSYQALIKELETDYPRYYDLKYSFIAPVSIKQLQQQLGGKSAIIEYFVGGQFIFIFLITENDWQYFRVEKPADFESQIQAFREIVQETDPAGKEAQFSELSYTFYQQLLSKPLATLAGNDKIKRLKIIPDELLLQFPFDLLLTEPTDKGLQARKAPYLIRKYALSYSYSNQLTFADRRTRRRVQKARSGFAGFGLEYDDFTLKGLQGTGLDKLDGENREMGRLKYSDDEILAAAKILDGETWINQEATKATFLAQAEQFRILHLAMHALVDDQYPLNSALIFSRAQDSTDFMLKASDVYNMQIGADLAVLSACNTGFGSLQKGEGVRSLARAFTYAGCDRLLATLWEASDYSTKDILLAFYEKAKAAPNTPIDVLLQEAKLEYLENAPPTFTTPSYWAHLMILGDTLPLDTHSSPFFGGNLYYIAVAVIALLLLILLTKRALVKRQNV
ncbi:MAG: CHAT domain-containing protein [Saprospiraceae bacterium]|nr:CHAT domain-containing protein [Saprospiraceae bacterium]